MGYQALYRVWRPQVFEDVVGQGHVTKTLQNALFKKKLRMPIYLQDLEVLEKRARQKY